jgi:hypothetical protein
MTTAKDVIRLNLSAADYMLKSYLKDLSDDDLLVTAVEGTNPIAWQIGHLISAERWLTDTVKPGASPAPPEGLDAAHGKETAAPNAFKLFASKDEYLKAWDAQRAATLAVLDALPDNQLENPSGIEFAPTFAAALNAIGGHALGHIGQFVAVRRTLGKPIVI